MTNINFGASQWLVRCVTVDMPFAFPPPFHYLCRENRYLLFLTENFAALEILHHYLSDIVRSSPNDSMTTATLGNDDGGHSAFEKMEPFILFGSSFPRDKEYTQVCEKNNIVLFYAMMMYCLDFESREVDTTVKVFFCVPLELCCSPRVEF